MSNVWLEARVNRILETAPCLLADPVAFESVQYELKLGLSNGLTVQVAG